MSDKNHLMEAKQHAVSPARRDLLKRVVYTAPALVVLGVVTPISKAYATSPLPGCPPGFPNNGGGTCTPL